MRFQEGVIDAIQFFPTLGFFAVGHKYFLDLDALPSQWGHKFAKIQRSYNAITDNRYAVTAQLIQDPVVGFKQARANANFVGPFRKADC